VTAMTTPADPAAPDAHPLDERLKKHGFSTPQARAVATALIDRHDGRLRPVADIAKAAGVDEQRTEAILRQMSRDGWATCADVDGQSCWRLNHASLFELTGESVHSRYSAASTASGYDLTLDARQGLYNEVRSSPGYKVLRDLAGGWRYFVEHLTNRALKHLIAGGMIDPCERAHWRDDTGAVDHLLRRHGFTGSSRASLLRADAREAALEAQQRADQKAGVPWDRVFDPAEHADALRKAHRRMPIDLDDPAVYAYVSDQRAAVCRRVGMDPSQAGDLSRWTLAHPEQFDAGVARCWRIGSRAWLDVVREQLGPFRGRVDRPVGVFLAPHPHKPDTGWVLYPALSMDLMRLIDQLGGRIERDLTEAVVPRDQIREFVDAINVNVLHADGHPSKSEVELVNHELGGEYVSAIDRSDVRDLWGQLHIDWSSHGLEMRVVTTNKRAMKREALGACQRPAKDSHTSRIRVSNTMDLGEAVQAAAERNLPVLLSTEASGHLDGKVRVGRMKGRPGQLTITTSDGVSAVTRRVLADEAIAQLRRLRDEGANVTLDAGAAQIVRMTTAKALNDDPVLLGRQAEVAALKVVGSGLDASQVGTGKSVTTGRALAHRAATTPRFRGAIVCDGRLLTQWREELEVGAPHRNMPPLAPNVRLLAVDDRTSPAAQLRAWDREIGVQPGVALIPHNILVRYPTDLCVIRYHVLIADEALQYVNPATEAHRALRHVRFNAVADCWTMTATPKGKTAGDLDVLVGLGVGDEAMITERTNTREAGNLLEADNAHRVRLNYGSTLVRITREDMAPWMPKIRPAEPLRVEPDAALKALLAEIRQGGRRSYRKLLDALRELKRIEEAQGKQHPAYKAAMAEVARCQAFVLANVNIYLDASVDPETLMHSNAVLAQALVRGGFVQPAITGGGDGLPSLRGIVAQTLAAVSADEQILVFAERTRPLLQLSETLRTRWGVTAPVASGKLTEAEFEDCKRRFVAGEFPVLMLTPVGNSGHNLQNASGIMHLDLPWVQVALEQRVGRAGRLGSVNEAVQSWIPYVIGGGIEHVVGILAPRGAEHHQLLDSFEGVDAADSTIATQLGAITREVADHKDAQGFDGTAARLRFAAAIFGA